MKKNSPYDPKEIADTIAKAAVELGYTASTLCRYAGADDSTYSRLCEGKNIGVLTVQKIFDRIAHERAQKAAK